MAIAMTQQHASQIRSRTTRERLGLQASGVPRAVAALQRAPGNQAVERAAHQVMASVCRPVRGYGHRHGPAARPPD
ncbi:hypothetical protein WH04_13965 [Aeromonas salmonicida subsp. salmonicida]|nr:hypothetical protein WH04_13965 [Aeromonas salmonicida subsp. salmonicida]